MQYTYTYYALVAIYDKTRCNKKRRIQIAETHKIKLRTKKQVFSQHTKNIYIKKKC